MQLALQFALLFGAKRANLAEEVGDLFLGLGFHYRTKVTGKRN
jgi:hypothetical protein